MIHPDLEPFLSVLKKYGVSKFEGCMDNVFRLEFFDLPPDWTASQLAPQDKPITRVVADPVDPK